MVLTSLIPLCSSTSSSPSSHSSLPLSSRSLSGCLFRPRPRCWSCERVLVGDVAGIPLPTVVRSARTWGGGDGGLPGGRHRP